MSSARWSISAFVVFVGDGDDGPSSAFFSFLRRRRSSGLESENHPGAFSTARPVVRARVFSPRASTVSPAPVTRNTDRTAWFSSAIFAAADCASASASSASTRRTAAAAAASAAAACASTEAPRSRNNAAVLRVMGLPRSTAASAGAARDWARVFAANVDACVVLRRRSSCATRREKWCKRWCAGRSVGPYGVLEATTTGTRLKRRGKYLRCGRGAARWARRGAMGAPAVRHLAPRARRRRRAWRARGVRGGARTRPRRRARERRPQRGKPEGRARDGAPAPTLTRLPSPRRVGRNSRASPRANAWRRREESTVRTFDTRRYTRRRRVRARAGEECSWFHPYPHKRYNERVRE